jgi:hypothetical protein
MSGVMEMSKLGSIIANSRRDRPIRERGRHRKNISQKSAARNLKKNGFSDINYEKPKNMKVGKTIEKSVESLVE